ncbi:hypothetical protein IC232_19385 [Microvirga sp. BT688]|uniref:hypothetical protein n=1 Tax=Microvirga sp. TaxID=1873136 RepID=UPI001682C491|nr:hypothetical protein [Microvirga sp.]MBD2748855.1 hypothetical protein [Microvirga sp.]
MTAPDLDMLMAAKSVRRKLIGTGRMILSHTRSWLSRSGKWLLGKNDHGCERNPVRDIEDDLKRRNVTSRECDGLL